MMPAVVEPEITSTLNSIVTTLSINRKDQAVNTS